MHNFCGTIDALDWMPEKRARNKGLVINKFRGDKTILDPGIIMLEERGRIPVCGVLPYMKLSLDDEDSLTTRFTRKGQWRSNDRSCPPAKDLQYFRFYGF